MALSWPSLTAGAPARTRGCSAAAASSGPRTARCSLRPWGLSGICVFDLSRRAEAGDVLALDLTCGMMDAELETAAATGTADGALDPQVAAALGAAGGNPASALATLRQARDLRFLVTDRAETERAQVTRGGLDVTGFFPETLEGARHAARTLCLWRGA